LPETTEGWAKIYPYLSNSDLHVHKFAEILSKEIDLMRENKLEKHLNNQVTIYNQRWSWDYRIKEWEEFLDGLY
jgi:RecB family exonuclease